MERPQSSRAALLGLALAAALASPARAVELVPAGEGHVVSLTGNGVLCDSGACADYDPEGGDAAAGANPWQRVFTMDVLPDNVVSLTTRRRPASLVASGTVDITSVFVYEPAYGSYHRLIVSPLGESHAEWTFTLDAPTSYALEGSLRAWAGGGAGLGEAHIELLGPGGFVAGAEIEAQPQCEGDCTVSDDLDTGGMLVAGTYTLVAEARAGNGNLLNQFMGLLARRSAWAEFFVAFTLGGPHVPEGGFAGIGVPAGTSPYSEANAVSADGDVVVGTGYTSAIDEGVRWEGGTLQGLGLLPGGDDARASAADADGSVVVGSGSSATVGPDGDEAWRWEAGSLASLGFLPGDGQSAASDVSADGSVVVGASAPVSFVPGETREAVRWDGATIAPLGDLPGGAFWSHASGVSADGSVVVGSSESAAGREAFRWEDGAMTGLGDLPGGDFWSRATAVSADGSVVVGSGDRPQGIQAFRWEDGVMVGLPDLPGGDVFGQAYDVSADGSVVVGRSWGHLGYEAVVWSEARGLRSLAQELRLCGHDLTGLDLESAEGVSADGRVIAGTLRGAAGTQGFRAELCDLPVFASSVPALGVGGAALLAATLLGVGGAARRRT